MKTLNAPVPTIELAKAGQSPWLDFISRDLIKSGKLKSYIQNGVLGVTSNPSIFEKAIGSGEKAYEVDVKKLAARGTSTFEIYDALTIADIQAACDLFLPVYQRSGGEHGYVSLEVAPGLAYETDSTVKEGLRLFNAVARPNVMIKVPATKDGIPAVRQLIASGVNVNITLIFSQAHYEQVADAYMAGLEDYAKKKGDLSKVHSVASVFVSRIDTYIDKTLDHLANETTASDQKKKILSLRGKAAIANSKNIYQSFKRLFYGDRFEALKKKGATIQKVLWASTSTKNPAYPELIYVETLIGKETVNTMPQSTLDAFIDHGTVRLNSIEEDAAAATQAFNALAAVHVHVDEVCNKLQKDGVKAFIESFDSLMKTLELAREKFLVGKKVQTSTYKFHLTSLELSGKISSHLEALRGQNFLERFLKSDASLWKNQAAHHEVILNRLGWLRAHDWIMGKLYEIDQLVIQLKKEKISDFVLLGMGGSSLAPEVMSLICQRQSKKPNFYVLDTTDPESVARVRKQIQIKSTIFLVASKSGGTVETMSQFKYFFEEVRQALGSKAGDAEIGARFVAITDGGSSLEKLAAEKKFRKAFINPANIGGRYSALSFFGMVPAAILGIDIRAILRSARGLYGEFEKQTDFGKNHSVYVGVLMGELAKLGKNKMTFLSTKKLASFATWTEQLIAESTGKEGVGIVPIEGEALADIEQYDAGRYFVVMRLKNEAWPKEVAAWMKQTIKAKLPIIEVVWPDESGIGGEFLNWEIITSVASSVMQINPFDEPNVKESKECTGALLEELKLKKKFPDLKGLIRSDQEVPFQNFFKKFPKDGYVAILAYVDRNVEHISALNRIRKILSKRLKAPVLVGFGPRYLHSIGQLYKGGPKNGYFIEFLAKDSKDVAVPGEHYSFSQLKMAQALGDNQATQSKGLPVLTCEVGPNILSSLQAFEKKALAWK